jgi:outer membrane protein TolC
MEPDFPGRLIAEQDMGELRKEKAVFRAALALVNWLENTSDDSQSAAGFIEIIAEVANRNLQVTRETLDLTRQRFDAGVTDNVEVVQAQESLTSADLDAINSVFANNVAKLTLARSIASAADELQLFLSLQ